MEEKVTVVWRVEEKVSIVWKIFKILGDGVNAETERFPKAHLCGEHTSSRGALGASRFKEWSFPRVPPQEKER